MKHIVWAICTPIRVLCDWWNKVWPGTSRSYADLKPGETQDTAFKIGEIIITKQEKRP